MNLQDKIALYESDILHKRVRLEALLYSDKRAVKRYRAAAAVVVPAIIFGITFARINPMLRIVAGGAARLALRFGASSLRGV